MRISTRFWPTRRGSPAMNGRLIKTPQGTWEYVLTIPFEQGRALAAHIPGARFVALNSRNHWVVDTEPAWAQLTAEIDGFLPGAPDVPENVGVLDALTPRELQVIELLAAGLDNGTIGRRLGISAKTVPNRVSVIFDKLGVNSRPQAIVRARDAGFGRKPGSE
jgi:DNA-binding NarL/FixJ family response regulator